MAAFTFYDAFFSFAGTDISDHVRELTVDLPDDVADFSAMGDHSDHMQKTLDNLTVSGVMLQDFAAGSTDTRMSGNGIFTEDGNAAFVIRPKQSPVGAANPEISGTLAIQSYQPGGSRIGEEALATFSGINAGAITIATS